MPRVTAAITTYNRACYLPRAIDSVLDQTYRDFELIVVDDGSTDETQQVIEPYLDRIRYFRQENRGKAEARNAAVRLAEGELVAFCDSDDFWLPNHIERQLAAMPARPEVGMVHGQVELVDANARPLPELTAEHRELFREAHRDGATYASYAANCRCLSSTILVRRDVFDTVGFYDPALPIEDYDFYLRLLLEYDIVFIDGPPLALHRVHDDCTTAEDLGTGQIATAEKHLALLDEHPEIPDARAARANFNLMIARSWRVLGDRRRARVAALRALRFGAPQALRVAL